MSSKPVTRSPQAARSLPEEGHGGWRVGDGDERRGDRARRRVELEHRRGDDAQRALRADEEVLQVVARVVLAQPAQPVPHAPVGQHHLQPQHLLAHVAVAQHLRAAGVGGDVAAHLAAAFRGERQGEEAAVFRRHALQLGEDAAGLDGDRVVVEVDGAHAVHARDVDAPPACPRRPGPRRRTGSCCRPAERSPRRPRRAARRPSTVSWVVAGLTRSAARPRNWPRQSTVCGSRSAGSVTSPRSPTMARNCSTSGAGRGGRSFIGASPVAGGS